VLPPPADTGTYGEVQDAQRRRGRKWRRKGREEIDSMGIRSTRTRILCGGGTRGWIISAQSVLVGAGFLIKLIPIVLVSIFPVEPV
jgi:hypothetical protein